MKFFSILLAFYFATPSFIAETATTSKEAEIKVYIFLHESCRISQFYTLNLKELHKTYGSENIVFEGVFPNQESKKEDLAAFQKQYGLSFKMTIDQNQALTKKLGASVTPEVIVYNMSQEKILYKGRIDDSYFRVGKRRQVTTTSELKDVLEAIHNGEAIKIKSKEAIGCFIRIN